jgi:GTP-binding protein
MVIRTTELVNTAFLPKQVVLDEIPKFLFLGRSNVGKSTLINKLIRRKKMAKTSSRPGKTVSINYYLMNGEFYFVDLPGYGYSKISKADQSRVNKLMDAFFKGSENIRLVFSLIDSRHGYLKADMEILETLMEKNLRILTIFTKSDKLSYSVLKNQLKNHQTKYGLKVIPFSANYENSELEILDIIGKALKE